MNNCPEKKSFTDLCLYIVTAELVGALSSIVSGVGFGAYYSTLEKPPFSPPGWVFPVVWAIMYALMGTAAYLTSKSCDRDRRGALRLYYAQLAVNFLWSPAFFRLKSFPLATLIVFLLLGMVMVLTVKLWTIRRSAAFTLMPYLVWTAYAAYLTIGFWLKN